MAEVGIISMVKKFRKFYFTEKQTDRTFPERSFQKPLEFFDFSEIAELFVGKFIFHLSFHFGDKA